jgi:hypothetical protein
MRGAGGTQGGTGRFFLGLAMMIAGGYLFFDAIQIVNHFRFGGAWFHMGRFGVTGGMVFIPFLFGIGMIFYNARNILGWVLLCATLIMLGVGVLSKLDMQLRSMSSFDLMIILGLLCGGIGLFISSLRTSKSIF